MVDVMRHEDFYHGGEYVNATSGVYVGWMSLEGAFADCMPLVNRKNDIVLIFHGENYLDRDMTGFLYDARSRPENSTASYLVDLYEELGDDFFARLNGWFSGLLVDLRRGRVVLFNDRYGMARLYFHEGKDEFIFSSEAKSILKVRPALRRIDGHSLAEYLKFNCVTRNKTLFRGISLLPPASSWIFERDKNLVRSRYFRFNEWEQQSILPTQEFYPQFAETVSRVFPDYASGPRKVGLSLTAGLDTRLVTSALKKRDMMLPCYTFGGSWGELYDIRTARRIAAICGQTFEAITADGQFLRQFPEFAKQAVFLSDGTHDAFGAHDVYFNRVARKIAPIRLTGKFGSEVVRIRRLIASESYQPGFLRPEICSIIDQLPSISQVEPEKHPLTKVVSEQISWYEFGRVAVEQSQLTLRTPYMDNELIKLMFQAPLHVRAAGSIQERYVKEKTPELAVVPTNLGRFISDNHSITRLMYLWFRALFKLEYIYLFATPHWMTRIDRKLSGLRLQKLLAGRQKWEGYRIWIKTDFSNFIRDTLLSPQARYVEFFERNSVQQMVARHLAGTHNYLNEINKALTLELICCSLLR